MIVKTVSYRMLKIDLLVYYLVRKVNAIQSVLAKRDHKVQMSILKFLYILHYLSKGAVR